MNAENLYDAWDNGDRHEIRKRFARREEIIRMAREAGYQHPDAVGTCEDFAYFDLERFAALVAAAEREACARMVDHIRREGGGTYGDAIRARGD